MAITFEEGLKKHLKPDSLLPVYILFGNDGYLKKLYCEKISKSISSTDDIFNYAKFDSDCDLQEVFDFTLQMPLMSDKKVSILCDFDFESANKTDFEKLCDLIKEVPDSCVLILWFDSLEFDSKKSAKFKKLVTLAENSGGIAACLDHRKIAELSSMLQDGAKKRGCTLDRTTAYYMVETIGDDINLLKNELIKLCNFSKEKPITKETIDEVCIKTVEASIYNLSKFILNCDTTKALSLLDELFFQRVEPIAVLYTISATFTDMFRVFSALDNNDSISSVKERYKYPKNKEFLVDNAARFVKSFDRKKLNLCLLALTDADKKLKSFSLDQRIVLEQLVIRLIYIISKGESID